MAHAIKQDFAEKVVWITGASSGIGEALAYLFRSRGAKLVVSSNEEAELLRVKAQCFGHEENVLALPLDLAEFDSFESKVAAVLDHFGAIDVLVNNGGISHRSLVKDTRPGVLKRIIDVDFTGHAALTAAVLPHMLVRRSGQIVVTSSLAGKPVPLDKLDNFTGQVANGNTYHPEGSTDSVPTLGTWPLLYNVGRDPGEAYNVAKQHPDVAHALEERLRAWSAEYYANPKGWK